MVPEPWPVGVGRVDCNPVSALHGLRTTDGGGTAGTCDDRQERMAVMRSLLALVLMLSYPATAIGGRKASVVTLTDSNFDEQVGSGEC